VHELRMREVSAAVDTPVTLLAGDQPEQAKMTNDILHQTRSLTGCLATATGRVARLPSACDLTVDILARPAGLAAAHHRATWHPAGHHRPVRQPRPTRPGPRRRLGTALPECQARQPPLRRHRINRSKETAGGDTTPAARRSAWRTLLPGHRRRICRPRCSPGRSGPGSPAGPGARPRPSRSRSSRISFAVGAVPAQFAG